LPLHLCPQGWITCIQNLQQWILSTNINDLNILYVIFGLVLYEDHII
jgi:hypothetical protein